MEKLKSFITPWGSATRISSIFLLTIEDKVVEFKLTPKMLGMCRKFGHAKFFYQAGTRFGCDYLSDFFLNLDFVSHIKVEDGNDLVIRKITKEKYLEQHDVIPRD